MTTTTTTNGNGAGGLSTLADARYLSLTTYKRDGTAVATPVWVTSDDGKRLLVWTAADAWKTKRIRRDSHVRVAACGSRGAVHGPSFDGEAKILDDTELVSDLILRKYGLQARAIRLYGSIMRRLRRQETAPSVTIAIEPTQLTQTGR